MLTFQDLLAVPDTPRDRAEFVRKVIAEHQSSDLYKTAKIADDYDRCQNTTTMHYNKFVTDVYGRVYVDKNAIVHRSCSNFYNILSNQLNQFVLANGVKFEDEAAKKALGADIDNQVQKAGKAALDGGVSFTFFNYDHCEVFPVYSRINGCFAPLMDEENGGLSSGVRFWQIDSSKPLRATLYELDGFTHFLWQKNQSKAPDPRKWLRVDQDCYMLPKTPYKTTVRESAAYGAEIYAGENYPEFPIVPMWGSELHQSYIVGLRDKIDAYDFVMNGWEDDLSLPQLYWIINGAGGMDDVDLQQFLDRLYTVKAAAPADGQEVSAVPVEIPVQARSELLKALRAQIYEDAQAFNPDDVKSGSTVVAQIEAAYEPLNQRANAYERQLDDYLRRLMRVAGVESEFSFTRDKITNTTELLNAYMLIASAIPQEYLIEKITNLLGDGDRLEEIKRMLDAEDAERMSVGTEATGQPEESNVNENES